MLRNLRALGLLSLLLLGASARAQDAEQLAGEFVALAKASDAPGLSKLFHYPPDMSEAERQKDATGVSKSLAWLLSKFGSLTSVKPTTDAVEFYELGVYGGSNAYWESISPVSSTQFVYEVTFSALGPGYLKVLVLNSEAATGRELQAAAFGIPSNAPRAKERAIELMMGLVEHSGTPAPPDFRKTLEEQLKPSRTSPTR